LAAYLIPDASTPRREEGLWHHTCFESFLLGKNTPAYREFNFSPSGAWQFYHFHHYREAERLELEASPSSSVLFDAADLLSVECTIPNRIIPTGKILHLGLSVVLEDNARRLSYWALHHGSNKPDFHDANTFTQVLFRP